MPYSMNRSMREKRGHAIISIANRTTVILEDLPNSGKLKASFRYQAGGNVSLSTEGMISMICVFWSKFLGWKA